MEKALSKKQIAINVYNQYKDQGRKVVIEKMVEIAGLSPAGGSTYFANLKNGTWKTTSPIDVLKAMSNSDLVKMYNTKAESPVVKFRDKSVAIERVMKLFNGIIPTMN